MHHRGSRAALERSDLAPEAGDADARATPGEIADRIVDAILAGRLRPGQRLGELSLGALFGVSRTLVREAMARLSARGMVEVNARRGWYVVQPSREEAAEAFHARIAIETGLVTALPGPLDAAGVRRLKRHVADERAAIRAGDPGRRSYLLGEFHVCLAECAGNALLADILKDLTARTTLIATLFQSTHDAMASCDDHAGIVAALEAGDRELAAERIRRHIEVVSGHLGARAATDDPLDALRSALLAPPPGTPTRSSTSESADAPPTAAARRTAARGKASADAPSRPARSSRTRADATAPLPSTPASTPRKGSRS